MSEKVSLSLPLRRWSGERGTYHLVQIDGQAAETITTHAALRRMEFGKQRGFGSVKCFAEIGGTRWKTSVFPMNIDDMSKRSKEWTLLISKKVMQAQDLAPGEPVTLALELL